MSVVDSNVLVHSATVQSPLNRQAKAAIARLIAADRVSVSRQIRREYIAVRTRPPTWSVTLSLAEATADTSAFAKQFRVLDDSPHVWSELIALSRRFVFGGKQVHDANIVATMLAHGETRL